VTTEIKQLDYTLGVIRYDFEANFKDRQDTIDYDNTQRAQENMK